MRKLVVFAALFAVLGLAVAAVSPAHAINVFPSCGADASSTVCSGTTDTLFGVGGFWNRILETFTYIIGALAVLMIIIGGMRYITSNGDQAQVTSAKNTILYSVIGLIVAIMAYAIVHFVIANIKV